VRISLQLDVAPLPDDDYRRLLDLLFADDEPASEEAAA
jgi:hypothetical protein